MKYKVGDIVYVNSLKWYNSNKNEDGYVFSKVGEFFFTPEMAVYCGKKVKIERANQKSYEIEGIDDYGWTDEMLYDIKKIRKKKLKRINSSI